MTCWWLRQRSRTRRKQTGQQAGSVAKTSETGCCPRLASRCRFAATSGAPLASMVESEDSEGSTTAPKANDEPLSFVLGQFRPDHMA